jgi:hypothetical protein
MIKGYFKKSLILVILGFVLHLFFINYFHVGMLWVFDRASRDSGLTFEPFGALGRALENLVERLICTPGRTHNRNLEE